MGTAVDKLSIVGSVVDKLLTVDKICSWQDINSWWNCWRQAIKCWWDLFSGVRAGDSSATGKALIFVKNLGTFCTTLMKLYLIVIECMNESLLRPRKHIKHI